jgi:hypothetical protein
MALKGSPSVELLERALAQVKPRLATVFERHAIREPDAAVILAQTMTALVYRWSEVSNPGLWILQTVERRSERCARQGPEGLGPPPTVPGQRQGD